MITIIYFVLKKMTQKVPSGKHESWMVTVLALHALCLNVSGPDTTTRHFPKKNICHDISTVDSGWTDAKDTNPTKIASVHIVMGCPNGRVKKVKNSEKKFLEQPRVTHILTPSLITTMSHWCGGSSGTNIGRELHFAGGIREECGGFIVKCQIDKLYLSLAFLHVSDQLQTVLEWQQGWWATVQGCQVGQGVKQTSNGKQTDGRFVAKFCPRSAELLYWICWN